MRFRMEFYLQSAPSFAVGALTKSIGFGLENGSKSKLKVLLRGATLLL